MKHQLLIVILLGLSLAPVGAGAGATNISGTWGLVYVTSDGDPITLTFVFIQEGEKLSGTFSGIGPMGKRPVTGTVKGNKVVFGWEMKGSGDKADLTVTFDGAIESPTKMTGTVGSPFCGAGCKWTATKKKK